MGDRGAIVIREGLDRCVLYTHWRGFEIEALAADGLRRALAAGRDHTDPDYLRRILFDRLAQSSQRTDTTGYGIGHRIPSDLNHPEVTIIVGTDGLTVDGEPVADWLAKR